MIRDVRLKWLIAIVALTLPAAAAQGVVIETVGVGDVGNVNDTHGAGYGGVSYAYNIGKYEVTNAQYSEFLNAVADVADPNGLYNADMGGGWNDTGGITRSGSYGSYTYTARDNRDNRPVNYVSWYDTLRFANWLHNGQSAGAQGPSTTEDGAYDMSLGSGVVRKLGALYFLPNENEWYKAAYYKGGGTDAGYWDYPTQSDTAPTAELPAGTDMVNGSANYKKDGNFLDTTYYTTEVGAYNAKPSESAYGTFDQGANVWEWNETTIVGNFRGWRGGSSATTDSMLLAASRYGWSLLNPEDPATGFRIAAAVPEPGSVLVWAGLAVGLIWFGRRK